MSSQLCDLHLIIHQAAVNTCFCQLSAVGSLRDVVLWKFFESKADSIQRRFHHTAGFTELTPRFGSCRAEPRTPRAPADVTETRKTASGYYGRLLWQPQVSVRASISHSVGARGGGRRTRREERGVRCGNASGVGEERGRGEKCEGGKSDGGV